MKIYLAGPDIFRPDAQEWADAARTLCVQYGFAPLLPDDHEETEPARISEGNLRLIKKAQIIVANLNPFRGAEPDSGTAFEVGYAVGLGKKAFGYVSNLQAMVQKVGAAGTRIDGVPVDANGYAIENFGLPVNLMLAESCIVVQGDLESCLQTIRSRPMV